MSYTRSALVGVLVAAAAMLGCLTVASAAAADNLTRIAHGRWPGLPAHRSAADLSPPQGPYRTYDDCTRAGQNGIERGYWSQYVCLPNGETLQWDLWTDDR